MKDDAEVQKSAKPEATQASTSTTSEQAVSQTSRSSTQSSSKTTSKPSAGRNILSADVEISGKISFTNDLVVDGKIEGEITSNGSLTVGENARIKAVIKTRSVVIYGKVHGNITVTGGVELKKNAEVVGDIVAGTLAIEAGAVFLGKSNVGAPKGGAAQGDSVVKPGSKISKPIQASGK